MDQLDLQMRNWSSRLRDDLGVLPPQSNCLASTIASEVSALHPDAKQRVKDKTPIPLDARLDELTTFQLWIDQIHGSHPNPAVVRAQVITQNYICFVYLSEACFSALMKELPSGSTTKKCCKFLTDNPVRAFRNAIAHSNWKYLPNFDGLEFWAKKGADPNEQPAKFQVCQQELSFWQALARCCAYASFLSL